MDILVTGGGGFLGLSFAVRALSLGHRVDLYDISFPTGAPSGSRMVVGDVADPLAFAGALDESGAEVVVHLATLLADTCASDPVRGVRVNCLGTATVFRASALQKVRRVVYASSVMALVPGSDHPRGDDRPVAPTTVYGATQAFSEHLATAWPRSPSSLEFLGLRFGWIYGPGRERGWREIQQTIEAFVAGAPEVRYPDYGIALDWTYIDDAAEVLIRALDSPTPTVTAYNVSGDYRTVPEAVGHLRRRFPGVRATPYPARLPPAAWDVACDRLATELGYVPATRMEEGLDRTIAAIEARRTSGVRLGRETRSHV